MSAFPNERGEAIAVLAEAGSPHSRLQGPKIKFCHRLNRPSRHAFGAIELDGGHNV